MKKWLRAKILPTVAANLIRALARSLQFREQDPAHFLKLLPPGPVLFAFWHNRLLLSPWLFAHYLPGRTGVAMISRSGDGQLITDIIGKFGLKAARGSSSKNGAQALRESIRIIQEDGHDLAITPDGPRGPRYQINPGILHLAAITQRPIIPLDFVYSRKWEMRSWDRFQVPKPGASCLVRVGLPILVPREFTDPAPYLQRLTEGMGE